MDKLIGWSEEGLGVLEAEPGGLERLLGDYCVLLRGLGRFQNALGTFQEVLRRQHPCQEFPDPPNQDF